jgi:hypothetical protein
VDRSHPRRTGEVEDARSTDTPHAASLAVVVYLRGRIGCYRPHKRLRKPRCAVGYHHPSGQFTCLRDTAQPAPDATQFWNTGSWGANGLGERNRPARHGG